MVAIHPGPHFIHPSPGGPSSGAFSSYDPKDPPASLQERIDEAHTA